jgi:hypothetical protein
MTTRIKSAIDHNSYYYVDYNYTQDIPGNFTTVTWTVGVHWGDYYWNIHNATMVFSAPTGASSGTTTIGTYNSGWPISGAGTNRDHPIASGTTTIHHYNSGLGSINFKGSAFWDTPGNFTGSINSTVVFPTIPHVPNAPSTPVLSAVTAHGMTATFTDGANGGATIDSRQLAYHITNTLTGAVIVASDGSTAVTGLNAGTTYYFWARTHNVAGYSAWSPVASKKTLNVPGAPSKPTLSGISPTSVTVSWTAPADNGGSPITGYQVGYGTSSTTPSTIVSGTSPKIITGLTPGTTYFFWVRAINAIGTGPWSPLAANATIAGARIKVGASWVIAIAYVRDGGVWKLAVPFVKDAGVWKEAG